MSRAASSTSNTTILFLSPASVVYVDAAACATSRSDVLSSRLTASCEATSALLPVPATSCAWSRLSATVAALPCWIWTRIATLPEFLTERYAPVRPAASVAGCSTCTICICWMSERGVAIVVSGGCWKECVRWCGGAGACESAPASIVVARYYSLLRASCERDERRQRRAAVRWRERHVPDRLTVVTVSDAERQLVVQEANVERLRLLRATLVDVQVLLQIDELEIALRAECRRVLDGDHRTPHERAVRRRGEAAGRQIDRDLRRARSERHGKELRLDRLIVEPDGVLPRCAPHAGVHLGDVLHVERRGCLRRLLRDHDHRAGILEAQPLTGTIAVEDHVLQRERDFLAERLLRDRGEGRRVLAEFVGQVPDPEQLVEVQLHLTELGLLCCRGVGLVRVEDLDTTEAASGLAARLVDRVDLETVRVGADAQTTDARENFAHLVGALENLGREFRLQRESAVRWNALAHAGCGGLNVEQPLIDCAWVPCGAHDREKLLAEVGEWLLGFALRHRGDHGCVLRGALRLQDLERRLGDGEPLVDQCLREIRVGDLVLFT